MSNLRQVIQDALCDDQGSETDCNERVDAVLTAVVQFLSDQETSVIVAEIARANLSRLPEMTGYLEAHAEITGDRGPLEFWIEIKQSITAPFRNWIAQFNRDQEDE